MRDGIDLPRFEKPGVHQSNWSVLANGEEGIGQGGGELAYVPIHHGCGFERGARQTSRTQSAERGVETATGELP